MSKTKHRQQHHDLEQVLWAILQQRVAADPEDALAAADAASLGETNSTLNPRFVAEVQSLHQAVAERAMGLAPPEALVGEAREHASWHAHEFTALTVLEFALLAPEAAQQLLGGVTAEARSGVRGSAEQLLAALRSP